MVTKLFVAWMFGDAVYATKLILSPNVIGDKNRTFGDENFRYQNYILL